MSNVRSEQERLSTVTPAARLTPPLQVVCKAYTVEGLRETTE